VLSLSSWWARARGRSIRSAAGADLCDSVPGAARRPSLREEHRYAGIAGASIDSTVSLTACAVNSER